ncbi:Rho GTPase-activating protein, partial [Acrasis kona]
PSHLKSVTIGLYDNINDTSPLKLDVSHKLKFSELIPLIQNKINVFLDPKIYSFVINPRADPNSKKGKRKFPSMSDPISLAKYNKHVEDPIIGNIDLQLFPPIQKIKKVFGAPLDAFQIMRKMSDVHSNNYNTLVPPFVLAALQFINAHALDETGIFRLSGNKSDCVQYIQDFNSGKYYNIILHSGVDIKDEEFYLSIFPKKTDPNLVCTILKQYLRELPDPLLTFERYDLFLKLFTHTKKEGLSLDELTQKVKTLIDSLPPINYETLLHLISICHKISSPPHVEKNKMTVDNMSIVIGPNILRSDKSLSLKDASNNIQAENAVTAFLIEHYSDIFEKDSIFDQNIVHTPRTPSDEGLKIKNHQLTEELMRLRLSHRVQQSTWSDRITEKDVEIRVLTDKLEVIEKHREGLLLKLDRDEERINALEQTADREALKNGNVVIRRDEEQLKRDLEQVDALFKILSHQEEQLLKMKSVLVRITQ